MANGCWVDVLPSEHVLIVYLDIVIIIIIIINNNNNYYYYYYY